MKKLILSAAVIFLFVINATAQSPIIVEFRDIVKNIPTNFQSIKKDLIEENKENNYKLFGTKLDDNPICDKFIYEPAGQPSVVILSFKVKNMADMMFKIFNTMVPQYLTEMNDMVKSGKYKGRDFQKDGKGVTEITDLNNNVVLQYQSDAEEHRLMFYGVKN